MRSRSLGLEAIASLEQHHTMLWRAGSHLFVAGGAALIIWYAYNNALDNAFAFDDHLAITNNHDVKDPTGHRIWTDDIWGKELSAHDSHKSFRPLLMMLFRTLWAISSEAWWFREVSLGAHFVATVLFYQLTQAIWSNPYVSLGATTLFAAHPIHVESVTAVVNMAEAFSSIFIIHSYLIFLRTTNGQAATQSRLRLFLLVIVWIAAVVVAALFKETGVTACLLVACKTVMDSVLYLFALYRNKGESSFLSNVAQAWRRRRAQVAAYAAFTFAAVLTLHVYMAARTLITSPHRATVLASPTDTLYHLLLKPIVEWQRESYLDSSQLLRRAENPFAQLQGWEKILSTMYLHCLYFMKLVFPVEQSPEYAFNCIPKVASVQDIRFTHSVVAYAALVVLLLLGFCQALCRGSGLWSAVATDTRTADASPQSTGGVDQGSAPNGHITPAPGGGNEGSVVDDEDAMPELIPVAQQPEEGDDDPAVLLHEKAVTSGRKRGAAPFTMVGLLDSPTVRAGKALPQPELVPEVENRPTESDGRAVATSAVAAEGVRGAKRGAIGYDALLHTLLLFTVFFLPASGVVFKLGTLLAERLMYTPSMPVCMLISAAVYYACSAVCGILMLDLRSGAVPAPTKSLTVRGALTVVLFLAAVATVTFAYAQRTIAYNPVWHDDNTLFVESLKVCPHSAKLNLQVSKVWSQKGDLKRARKHLQRAMEIDPDFCDTGYQDVVLTAAGEGKGATLDLAAEKAIKNLHCIYTNTATFSLLSQIWSAQLQSVTSSGNKQLLYREMEKHGRIAETGEVKFLAAQKYIEASSIAFDAGQADDAIALSDKARRIITSLESAQGNGTATAIAATDGEVETEVTADLRCRIFTLSGLFRAMQLPILKEAAGQNGKTMGKSKPKASGKAEAKVLELLRRAVFRDCKEAVTGLPYPAAGPVTGRGNIVVEHLPIAINHLVSLWTALANRRQQQRDANLSAHLVQYATDLTQAFYVAELLRSRTRYPDESASSRQSSVPPGTLYKVPVLENAKIKELCETLAKFSSNAHYLVGSQQLQAGTVASAVDSLRQSLFVLVPPSVERQVDALATGRNVSGLASATIEELPALTLGKEACTSMHWLSETLASIADSRADPYLVAELTTYLRMLIDCLKTKVYTSPKLSVAALKQLVRSLTPKIDAAAVAGTGIGGVALGEEL